MKFVKYLLVVASISGLLACGGSGGTADSTNPTQVHNNASGSTIASGIDVTNIHQLMVAPPDISSSVLASIGKSINSLLYAIAGIRDAFAQTSHDYPVANRSYDVFTSINILNSSDISTKILGLMGPSCTQYPTL